MARPLAGTFQAVSAGHAFSCGRRSDGSVTCWGNNDYGLIEVPVL